MSARNRSAQLKARALQKALNIGYQHALEQVSNNANARQSSLAEVQREQDRKLLRRYLAEMSYDDRLRVFHNYVCRDQLAAGDLSQLKARTIASACEKAGREVRQRLDQKVLGAISLEEQLASALRRERVTDDSRVLLDASPVLRSAGIRVYLRWHLKRSLEIYLDEFGYEVKGSRVSRVVDAVEQFEASGLEAFIEHARLAVGARTVQLCLIHEHALVRYLQQRGWRDEHEGAYWRYGEVPDTLYMRTAEAHAELGELLRELSQSKMRMARDLT